MIELDVKIEAGDLYDYMLMHSYNNVSGILGSAFGGLLVVFGTMEQKWIYVILGIVLLLYLPWTLFLKSRQQILNNPVFQKPLHYMLDETGITISQGEVEQHQDWADMYKAVSTSKSIIVYTSKVNATIFPKRELGEKRIHVIEMISTNMPSAKVKIKM